MTVNAHRLYDSDNYLRGEEGYSGADDNVMFPEMILSMLSERLPAAISL